MVLTLGSTSFYPDGLFTEYAYDAMGNTVAVTQPSAGLPGPTTFYDYDLFNLLRQVTQPGGVVTAFAYDSHDNLISVIDAEELQTQYFYDDMGRVIVVESPDTGVTYYAYDPGGNLISKRDANGTVLTYEYDSLTRLTAIIFPDSAENITFGYDEGLSGRGRMTTMIDPSGTATYEYNSRGQVVRETKVMGEGTSTIEYAYSLGGRLTGITYPSGLTITYQLDGSGQVGRVTGEFRGQEIVLADGITHMPFGLSESVTLGNGLAASRTYDLLYRLRTIQAGSVMDRSYTYYPDGNISQIQDLADSTRTQEFTYDHLDRLISATGIYGTITYTYENVGNRLTRKENDQPEAYSYIPNTNKLLQVQGVETREFVHDPVGNITQMTRQPPDPPSVSGYDVGFYNYVYDGRNRRIKEIDVDTTIIFWYNSSGQMLGEWTVGGGFETDYIYLDGNLLAMVLVPIGPGSPMVF